MDDQIVVDLLNKLLASDPHAAEELVKHKANVNGSCCELFGLEGQNLSLMGVLNEILRRHGNDVIVGAALDDNDRIKFFYPIDQRSKYASE